MISVIQILRWESTVPTPTEVTAFTRLPSKVPNRVIEYVIHEILEDSWGIVQTEGCYQFPQKTPDGY